MQRTIPDPGFAGDDGGADPELARALATYAAGSGGRWDVHRALAGRRVMVAVVAIAQEVDDAGVEKSTDMSVITVRGEDGRTAMPVFTSLATLEAWYPQARPVPVEAEKACLAAVVEGADLVVVDPAGPVTFPVEGPALRALAQGRVPTAPQEDPEVTAAIRSALVAEPGISRAGLLPSSESDAVLAVVLGAEVTQSDGAALVHRVGGRLAADPVLRERLDRGLDLALLPPGAEPGGTVLVDRLLG